ncbi:MAG: ATP-binding cassette domain-containing protein [Chitinivibrionales bacterium]|nr:ATP-binding cassette domain-containing protein [Chitinivibrionales bacterium]
MVDVRQLCFSYTGSAKLFDNLTFSLERGKVYGLLGKNGAGKTSLLKILCGLRYAGAGACTVDGIDCASRSLPQLQHVFLLPEEIPSYPFSAAKLAVVRGPFYPRFDAALYRSLLGELDVPSDRPMAKLSHGQRKKAAVAFGLATNCPLMLLDEPTNGLDIPSKSIFRRVVARCVNDDRTMVISTHQVRDVEHLIDSVAIIDGGSIVLQAALAQVSDKLAVAAEPAAGAEVLYAEDLPGGRRRCLVRNSGIGDGQVDLEFLFNAVITNPRQTAEALGAPETTS